MRNEARLERRLAQVAALQTLRATASRAELSVAQMERATAEDVLAGHGRALAGGMQEMDALLGSDVLDFDRWRIGRMVIENLAAAHSAASDVVSCLEKEEIEAQAAFGRESARKHRAEAMHRKLARRLGEKRDEFSTLEANGLATVRKMMKRP